MMLDDPEWPEGQAPHELGRAQFGRISIANSDAEARAYMDSAIEAGWRAVTELSGVAGRALSVPVVNGLSSRPHPLRAYSLSVKLLE